MAKFGAIPKEPPASKALDDLAPGFRANVEQILARDPNRVIAESYRSPARSDWLFGMGRDYDDGRGVVTKAGAGASWHNYGLAVDVIHRVHGWDATSAFWDALAADAIAAGLTAGAKWTFRDLPHIQWGKMSASPNDHAKTALAAGAVESLWAEVGAA